MGLHIMPRNQELSYRGDPEPPLLMYHPDLHSECGQHATGSRTGGKKKRRHGAIFASEMWRSPVAQVDPHRKHTTSYDNNGTIISYEGATAPGSGGSVGTGYASGTEALGETIHTDSEYDQARFNKPSHEDDEAREQEDEEDKYGTGEFPVAS